MRGYLWIESKGTLIEAVLGPEGVRSLAISLSAGIVAGALAAGLKLHLGLPGHKALLWMTPVIAARLLGRCRAGATAGALSAAFVSIGMGGNLAGSLSGLPLVGAAGLLIDATVAYLEKCKASAAKTIAAVAFSAMLANLICCLKRLLIPTGLTPHDIFSSADLLMRPLSYGFFGFLSGLIGAIAAHVLRRGKTPSRQHRAGSRVSGS